MQLYLAVWLERGNPHPPTAETFPKAQKSTPGERALNTNLQHAGHPKPVGSPKITPRPQLEMFPTFKSKLSAQQYFTVHPAPLWQGQVTERFSSIVVYKGLKKHRERTCLTVSSYSIYRFRMLLRFTIPTQTTQVPRLR